MVNYFHDDTFVVILKLLINSEFIIFRGIESGLLSHKLLCLKVFGD